VRGQWEDGKRFTVVVRHVDGRGGHINRLTHALVEDSHPGPPSGPEAPPASVHEPCAVSAASFALH
jgi:hypothetical protein